MSAPTPHDFDGLASKAFNAADLDSLLALYEAEASLVGEPGSPPATGHAAIREGFQEFLALNAPLDLRTRSVVQSAGLAVVYSDYSLRGTDPDGNDFEVAGRSTVVLRQQPDGAWLAVIDDTSSGG